jgi:hypothetical protein
VPWSIPHTNIPRQSADTPQKKPESPTTVADRDHSASAFGAEFISRCLAAFLQELDFPSSFFLNDLYSCILVPGFKIDKHTKCRRSSVSIKCSALTAKWLWSPGVSTILLQVPKIHGYLGQDRPLTALPCRFSRTRTTYRYSIPSCRRKKSIRLSPKGRRPTGH